MNRVNILWTGGLDSTYRILELSMREIEIQPYYLADVNPSMQYELKAILNITETILKRPQTKCHLLPLIVVHPCQIAANEKITKAWSKLHEQTHLGSQYDYIARFASQYNLILELGIEKDPHKSTIQRCIELYGGAVKRDGCMVANCDKEEMQLIFSNMRFPLPLFEMTKQDEIKCYKGWQAEDVLKRIQFCYHPIDGKPCGLCDPCETYIEVGLGAMVPTTRYRLYKLRQKHIKLFKSLRKIKHLVKVF